MYCYIESENFVDDNGDRQRLFTVGFYKPNGEFEPDSDTAHRSNAAARVHYLNGGLDDTTASAITTLCNSIYEYGIMVQPRG